MREQAIANATLHGQLAEARLEALRLQLNPHFLFNALNTIASLVHSDPAKADTAIGALSSFLRGSVGSARGDLITLEDDLRLLDAYPEIESVRFEWLVVDLDVRDELRSALVPAFTLQLLVENAVRHDLAPRGGGGRVHVAAQREGSVLELRVADDGIGVSSRTSSRSLGIGLSNIACNS